MNPKINHHYTIPYKNLGHFDWKKYNDVVDLTEYKARIMPKLVDIASNLRRNGGSRQEVIVLNREQEFMSCLISLQFQIEEGVLVLIASYRSQCEISGRPCDTLMNQYVATSVMNMLGLKKHKIHVCVGNYHVNPMAVL